MKKYKTFIVEDQTAPLERLLLLLKAYPKVIDLDSIVIARSFNEAQDIILNGEQFDLSIMDKMLGGKTCFDLISKENKDSFGIIVLNTVDKKSQKYFQEISLLGNYLVLPKPYNKDDVAGLVNQLISFNRPISEELDDDSPIWLKEKSKGFPVKQNDIVYIEVNDNYCYIYFINNGICRKHIATKQLSHYEELLNRKMFFRISDKYLINLEYISTYEDGNIKLKPKYENAEINLTLAKNKSKAFHDRFKK